MNQLGQIRKGRKFDQVLEGARSVFMADGFEGANVDHFLGWLASLECGVDLLDSGNYRLPSRYG